MITMQRSTYTDPDFQNLCAALDKEFWVRYPDTQQNFEPYNKVDQSARVVLAYHKQDAVGCGCFRSMGEEYTIEIKRMYVMPEFRGNRIAGSILMELEQWAKAEGYLISKLETGVNQPEAVSLYERCGYNQIPNYPPYVGVAESICMVKKLTGT